VDFELRRIYRRADFGLPEDRVLFMFSYDFDSFVARKNPRACIEAFQLAFAPHRREVALVIKMLHAQRHPQALRALRELARADRRILLLDVSLSRDESYGLLSVCDVYLSLHRAEGFGLGMAEAMRLGKPVVATAYSGNLAFMRPDNACLVDYQLVPVGEGEYPHGVGQYWAQPDLAHAARLMQQLMDNADLRERLGARAAQFMREHFSTAVAGGRIRKRLELLAARGGAP
jgi:glycosyltransferase involved in cell wall biosynthesis